MMLNHFHLRITVTEEEPAAGQTIALVAMSPSAWSVVFVVILALALFRTNQTQPTSGPAPDFQLTLFEGYPGNAGKNPVKLV